MLSIYYYAGLVYGDNDISHHGIKGQKWGIRRYQNEDGTLSEAGRKRQSRYDKTIERGKSLLDKNRTKAGAVGRTVGRQALLQIGVSAAATALGAASAAKLLNSYGSINDLTKFASTVTKGSSAIQTLFIAGTAANIVKGARDYRDIGRAQKAGYTQRKYRNGYDAYIEQERKSN